MKGHAVQPTTALAPRLARRLRSLRERCWPGVTVTQQQLAEALGVSVASISSWESRNVPPAQRLRAYARFFATRRSVESGRLLDDDELTEDERARRSDLEQELLALRAGALDTGYAPAVDTDGITPGLWRFEDGKPITIVVAEMPAELRARFAPYTDPDDPQYVELYTYADVDSLVELHGHIRAVNPDSEVGFRTVSALRSDDFTTHLALLGGVDWNVLTRDLLKRLPVPVSQVSPEGDPASGGFEVVKGGERRRYHPVFTEKDGRKMLVEDVAHFFRAPNPFNRKRTVTICNGMFSRGTYGAVRALTDSRFRDRNAEYIHERFPRGDTFSILTRVPILNGEVLTPDWSLPETRLHEWPEVGS